ncbi:hypothetical protein [Streptomyces sp. IBSBF 2435]|uniref:hypothetical protein n=1 Tax=Streptomyces sp. IBSBF 2435 TaxID=2903531 RepID=UPI002FDBBE13
MGGFSLGGHLAFYAASQVPLSVAAVVYPGWLDVAGTALSTPDPLLDLARGSPSRGAGCWFWSARTIMWSRRIRPG